MSSIPRSHLVRFAQLAALWAYAVSQPVLSYIEGNDELLVFTDATRAQTVGFALLLAVGPPLAAVLYAAAAGLVSRWVGDMLFVASLGAFLVPLASQVVKLLEPGGLPALLAILGISASGVACYLRWRAVRLFVTAAVVLPIVSLAWFLHAIPAPVEPALAGVAAPASRTPVVVVVLDELPLTSLLTRGGGIDSVRYPAFARLAREATWYPRATTVDSHTSGAVPAILTGRMAVEGAVPTLAAYPRNLFTMLGGMRPLRVHESQTRLCPQSLCPRSRPSFLGAVDTLFDAVRLPFVLDVVPGSLSGDGPEVRPVDPVFWRAVTSTARDYEEFLAQITRDEPEGSVHFLHLLLPHTPWRYLPSGRRFTFPADDAKDVDGVWVDSAWRVQQGFQRHVLQVRYVDRLLGRLVRRLERVGLYDDALLVVVADHGASFRAGSPRRRATATTFADVASVPLFVKYPGQARGVVDRRAARTIDLLPTIADVLGVRHGWHLDGTSLRGAPPSRAYAVVAGPEDTLRAPMRTVARQNEMTIRRKVLVLGEGRDSLFRLGVHRQLLGRAVDASPRSRDLLVELQHTSELSHVRTDARVVPVFIEGTLQEGRVPDRVELAIAVNGRVRALTRCFLFRGKQRFQALVPESSLRDGRNRVDVYAIEARDSRIRLVRLGGTGGRA